MKEPEQRENVIQQYPEVVSELRQTTLDFMKEHGASSGRLQPFEDGDGTPPLPLDTKLWGFRDEKGLWITFPNEEQARLYVSFDAPGPKRVWEETTFGRVLDDNPKNLVRMWQYYWAQDLA